MRLNATHLLAVVVAVALVTSCDWSEIRENHYESFAELSAAEEPGNWIPVFIPVSAVNIRERHKVDTGAELLSFGCARIEDLDLARQHCSEVKPEQITFPVQGFLGADWWPADIQAHAANHGAHEFYRCDREAYLAIRQSQNQGQHNGYYWRISIAGQ